MRKYLDNAPHPHSPMGDESTSSDVYTSHSHYQALIEASQDIMIVLDLHHVIRDINRKGCCWLDVERNVVLGQRVQQIVPLANRTHFEHHLSSIWTTGETCRLQTQVNHPHCHWLDIELVPIKSNGTDEVLAVWFIARDISLFMKEIEQRKQAEQQLQKALQDKETRRQELHHRIKNNLQVVSAILSLQARFVNDGEIVEVLHDSRARIHAIAMIHETLYQLPDGVEEANFTTYLRRLVKASIFAHTDRSLLINTQFELDPIFLNLETAIPCGLLVNEVLMNALKHAFPHQKNGTIAILLKENIPQHPLEESSTPLSNQSFIVQTAPNQSSEPPLSHQTESEFSDYAAQYHYRLSICDDGIGFPETLDPETMESVGMSLIRDLTYQLSGQYRIKRQEQNCGTCFELFFSPLNH